MLIYLVCVFHLKKRLTILDAELHHHRARPEHIAVHCNVVAEDLGEHPSGLQLPVHHFVMHPHLPLHHPISRWMYVIPGALYFVGVAEVALVGLGAWLEEVL